MVCLSNSLPSQLTSPADQASNMQNPRKNQARQTASALQILKFSVYCSVI